MTIREKIAKDKAEFILKSSDILSKQVNQAQKKLLSFIFDSLLEQLETSNGKILFNGKNISIASAIDKVYDEFNKSIHFSVVERFTNDLLNVSKLSASYFKTFDFTTFKEGKTCL